MSQAGYQKFVGTLAPGDDTASLRFICTAVTVQIKNNINALVSL